MEQELSAQVKAASAVTWFQFSLPGHRMAAFRAHWLLMPAFPVLQGQVVKATASFPVRLEQQPCPGACARKGMLSLLPALPH